MNGLKGSIIFFLLACSCTNDGILNAELLRRKEKVRKLNVKTRNSLQKNENLNKEIELLDSDLHRKFIENK